MIIKTTGKNRVFYSLFLNCHCQVQCGNKTQSVESCDNYCRKYSCWCLLETNLLIELLQRIHLTSTLCIFDKSLTYPTNIIYGNCRTAAADVEATSRALAALAWHHKTLVLDKQQNYGKKTHTTGCGAPFRSFKFQVAARSRRHDPPVEPAAWSIMTFDEKQPSNVI